MSHVTRGIAGTCLLALGWTAVERSAARAADAEELVVVAERTSADLWRTPFTVRTVRYDGDTPPACTRALPEALAAWPSAMIQKTSNGQGSPFLRGFTGYRTLMLVDGIRLNNAVFRDGPNQYWNTVDHLSLRGLEAVMGPASVLHGSDAIGGAVNALPVEPPAGPDAEWTGRGHARYASAEDSAMGRAEVAGPLAPGTTFVTGLSLKQFGDLEGGRSVGEQPHTGYDEWAFDARIAQTLGETGRLTLSHQSVRQSDIWRTHRTVHGTDWRGLSHGTDLEHSFDQGRDLTWLRLEAEPDTAAVDRITLTVHRQAMTEDVFRIRESGAKDEQGFRVVTWGAAAQMESDSALGRTTWGAEALRDEVGSYSRKLHDDGSVKSAAIQGPVGDDATYDTVGAFAQHAFPLADGRLRVLPGARYAYNRAEARRVQHPVTGEATRISGSWDTVVGSLRAVWTADEAETLHVFAGVSQGYRAPNLSDLTRFDIARSDELETPVTDLDPERFLSFEAGVKWRAEPVSLQATAYRTNIRDLIVRAPTGRVLEDDLREVTKRNAGDGYVQGVECAGAWQVHDDWALRGVASWMEGEVDGYPESADRKERDPLSRIMPLTAELALRWAPLGRRWWTEVAVRAADKADRLSADDKRDTQRIPPGGTPGHVVWIARGGVQVTPNLACSLAVENVADEDYRIHGSGVNEPGRNVVLALDARF